MQKVKEKLGLGGERAAEEAELRAEGHTGAHHTGHGLGTTAERPYDRDYAGTEYTGGVAGGPAYAGHGMASGYTEGVQTVDVPVVQKTTTTTAAMPAAAEAPVTAQGEAAVCGQEFFVKVEDRPVVKERVEKILEHVPVEKEFVVETRATGVEREIPGGEVEHLGTVERIVGVTPPKAPCE